MENVLNICRQYRAYILAAAAVGVVLFIRKSRKQRRKRICGVDYPADTIIVHKMYKCHHAPSMYYHDIKLETYMRVANMTYTNVFSRGRLERGPKDTFPWIEYNGAEIGGCQPIVNFFNKELKVDLNNKLPPYERAKAWGLQKWIDDYTVWLITYTNYCLFTEEFFNSHPTIYLPWYAALCMVRRHLKKMCYTQGVGKLSREEVGDAICRDITTLGHLLGDNKYFMGGDEATALDCSAFAILVEIMYCTADSSPGKRFLTDNFANLNQYIGRMKERYWPDWDECLAK